MRRWFFRQVRKVLVLVAVCLLTILGVWTYQSQQGPPLALWHTYVPHELSVAELDRSSWTEYVAAENALFDDVRREVTDKLDSADRVANNRYFDGSPVYPGHFKQDWNRSFILEPAGAPIGAVVLLHGLTDAPYSLRHIAESYRDRGFVAIGIRLPAHGTVPAALTDVTWKDWMAATRLAVREARRRVGPTAPIHLVGYSNGGALAMMYELDALQDSKLARPTRIVLMSPMIGVTRFARFAGFAGLPSIFPAFAKTAWLGILPEFNPFKYNSFPVNAARQSFLLSDELQKRIASMSSRGQLAEIAPVLAFQSVVDNTVSTRAVATALFDQLPSNGSELVLFDLNRNSDVAPLFRPAAMAVLSDILSPPPRRFRTAIIADQGPVGDEVVERVTDAGQTTEQIRPIGLSYPEDVYSLSHVALPFPVTDGLYGTHPDPNDNFGILLGSIEARGERDTLILSLDTLLRMSSNPFFPYMIERIDQLITPATAMPAPAAAAAPPAVETPPVADTAPAAIEPAPDGEGP